MSLDDVLDQYDAMSGCVWYLIFKDNQITWIKMEKFDLDTKELKGRGAFGWDVHLIFDFAVCELKRTLAELFDIWFI